MARAAQCNRFAPARHPGGPRSARACEVGADGVDSPQWLRAGVAELVDAPDSKSGSGNRVSVRVRPPAPPLDRRRALAEKTRLRRAHPAIRHGLPTTRLDEQATAYLLSNPDYRAPVVYDSSHLVITGASAQHLLAMKLEAARRTDQADIVALLRALPSGTRNPPSMSPSWSRVRRRVTRRGNVVEDPLPASTSRQPHPSVRARRSCTDGVTNGRSGAGIGQRQAQILGADACRRLCARVVPSGSAGRSRDPDPGGRRRFPQPIHRFFSGHAARPRPPLAQSCASKCRSARLKRIGCKRMRKVVDRPPDPLRAQIRRS